MTDGSEVVACVGRDFCIYFCPFVFSLRDAPLFPFVNT